MYLFAWLSTRETTTTSKTAYFLVSLITLDLIDGFKKTLNGMKQFQFVNEANIEVTSS